MLPAPEPVARWPLPVLRLRQLVGCLLLTALAFSQRPGLVGNDTKLDLTADPAAFLARALHLWNPQVAFGQLQNQAYGYLFPMGPFHLLGIEAGLPAWVVQRAWMALLLVTAFLGTLRLGARLGIGTPATRLLAGLAYALSPRVLTEIGGISSELLPLVLLPWVVVPLVGPSAGAAPRRAAARSGVAVLLMGAVNATAALAVLPLPAVFLLAGLRTPAGRRLAAWEGLAVTLACAWWVGPLLLQGAYALPFLDWIETAAVTTRPTSLVATLRGTSHWLAYLAVGGRPWWTAGWTLVTSPVVLLDTAVVAALGLAGLAARGMPARRRLAVAAALGLVAVTAGHVGPLEPPWAHAVRGLLDGPLAAFRNVHKFDPLLRLPLALGLAHLLASPRLVANRRAGALVAVVALAGAATPALAGQLVPAGAYQTLPSWWRQSATWLDARADEGHALLVPGGSLGEYSWGRPLDEPLQALTSRTTWAVRDAVPLGSAGLTRILDAVEQQLDSGRGSVGLAPLLQRAGVRFLVVRNDLDRGRTGAPRPAVVHAALDGSPGLTPVASFGPRTGFPQVENGLLADDGLDLAYPAVQIYTVGPVQPPVVALPQAGTQVLSGAPESLLQLAERNLLGPATVLAGDGDPGPDAVRVVTDGLRRREVAFGKGRDNGSETLTADAPVRVDQPVADFSVVPGEQHLTTARLLGARRVTASSSASDPGSLLLRSPARQPWSAVDGDPDTAWVSGSLGGAVGQWLQVDLDTPRDVTRARLAVLDDRMALGPAVSTVSVRTDRGTVTTRLRPGGAEQPLSVPAGVTSSVRVTVTGVAGSDGPGVLAGLRELVLPGVSISRTLVVPDDAPPGVPTRRYLFDRGTPAGNGCLPAGCSPDLVRPAEEPVRLDRTFTVPAATSLPLTGTALPVAGTALDALLDHGAPVRVTASSRLVPDPADRPGALADGDTGTAWLAARDDRHPALTLRWNGVRALAGLTLYRRPGLAAAAPTLVEVRVAGRRFRLDVPADGRLSFPTVRASALTLKVLAHRTLLTGDARTGGLVPLPVGLSEIELPGLASSSPAADAPVSLPCGAGPPLAVDGRSLPSAVLATRADLLRTRPVLLSVCAPGPQVALSAGQHRLTGGTAGALQVQGMTVGSPLPDQVPAARPTQVRRWDAEHREVDLAPGAASWLVVHENANPGWSATLGGVRLMSARVDGWQQAFVVPAGAGGRVVLTYGPGTRYRSELLVGLAAALLLLLLSEPWRRGRRGQVQRAADLPVCPEPARRRRLPSPAVGVLLAALALFGLGGVAGLGALAVGLLVHRRAPRAAPWLAGGALLAAGALDALSPWAGSRPPVAGGVLTQALCLLAVAAAATTVVGSGAVSRSPRRPQGWLARSATTSGAPSRGAGS